MKTTASTKRSERGNALFLILIAVALFAALSYAVTQSGRGSGSVSKEQSLIAASQITQYPAAIRTAVTRMVITGTSTNVASFDVADTSERGVFGSAGGGAIVQDPPANIGTATAWRFKAIPVTAAGGFFISGVGTDLDVIGRDAIAFLDGVTIDICRSILRGLGLSTTVRQEAATLVLTSAQEGDPNAIAVDTDASQDGGTTATTSDAGNNAYSFDIWNTAAPTIDPQAFACIDSDAVAGTENYIYYHAVIEQ